MTLTNFLQSKSDEIFYSDVDLYKQIRNFVINTYKQHGDNLVSCNFYNESTNLFYNDNGDEESFYLNQKFNYKTLLKTIPLDEIPILRFNLSNLTKVSEIVINIGSVPNSEERYRVNINFLAYLRYVIKKDKKQKDVYVQNVLKTSCNNVDYYLPKSSLSTESLLEVVLDLIKKDLKENV